MKKKVRHVKILARCGMLRHAAARCGMLQNPHVQLQKKGGAACCGMLRHAAACCGCTSLPCTCVLLFGGITASCTTALYAFSLAERQKTEALQFTPQTAKNATEASFPRFSWDMGMYMSDGADEMINAAYAVWLVVIWLVCH